MDSVRIGKMTMPVSTGELVELVNERRKWRGQAPLPEDMTNDNLRISFNSVEYRTDLINIAFLGHLEHDVLIPYPSNAWMESTLPKETFAEVHSINYYQQINGDCELTHAVEDLYRIIKPGGIAYVGVPNFELILKKIVETKNEGQRLQWEHFLFSRNVDERGLFYNQSICDFSRLRSRGLFAKFKSVTQDEGFGSEYEKYLTMEPNEYNISGVTDKMRKEHLKLRRNKRVRRTPCILPRCKSKAGQVELRRAPSVYCRRHYRRAKAKLIEAQERALRIMIVLEK